MVVIVLKDLFFAIQLLEEQAQVLIASLQSLPFSLIHNLIKHLLKVLPFYNNDRSLNQIYHFIIVPISNKI